MEGAQGTAAAQDEGSPAKGVPRLLEKAEPCRKRRATVCLGDEVQAHADGVDVRPDGVWQDVVVVVDVPAQSVTVQVRREAERVE